MYLEYKFI